VLFSPRGPPYTCCSLPVRVVGAFLTSTARSALSVLSRARHRPTTYWPHRLPSFLAVAHIPYHLKPILSLYLHFNFEIRAGLLSRCACHFRVVPSASCLQGRWNPAEIQHPGLRISRPLPFIYTEFY
jgi:hypothetical protein